MLVASFVLWRHQYRVVLRSHDAIDAYGDDFSYGEVMLTGKGGKGHAMGLVFP